MTLTLEHLGSEFDAFQTQQRAVDELQKNAREFAFNQFLKKGLPTRKMERWKYTDVRKYLKPDYSVSKPIQVDHLNEIDAKIRMVPGSHQVVFVNGHYQPQLSTLRSSEFKGALLPISDLLIAGDALQTPSIDAEDQPFTELNSAFMQDGLYLKLAKGQIVKEPIYCLFNSLECEQATMVHPHIYLCLAEGAEATFVEHYVSTDEQLVFNNITTEISLKANAQLTHIKIQEEGRQASHIDRNRIQQERDSHYSFMSIALGAGFSRTDTEVDFQEEGAVCSLAGVYLGTDNQCVDNHALIHHRVPQCTSQVAYKGVLDGASHGVFNAKAIVYKNAQKTSASQNNQNLLLSSRANIDTKPELEIYADDVKCAHGATVGQLDEEAVFYLRSRGIAEETARALLINAFAEEILEQVSDATIRSYVSERVLSKLSSQTLNKPLD